MRWPPVKQHNFVCTYCRRSVRRHGNSLGRGDIPCATCGDLCEDIGAKRPVPKRSDLKAWKQLQNDLNPPRAERIAALERRLEAWGNESLSPAGVPWPRPRQAELDASRAQAKRELEVLKQLHSKRTGSQPSAVYRPPFRRGADRARRAESDGGI